MDVDNTVQFFKALADRSRLLLVQALIEKPQYLEELAKRLNLANSTVSFHLKKLEIVGLIGKRKNQYYTIFYPENKNFKLTLEEMMEFDFDQKIVQDERIIKYKEKILKSFFKDGKIIQIPAQKQKRWIVFEQILELFEFGRKYTEPEVNEIIKPFNEDYCLIRRTFVEENVMNRSDRVYWITQNYENFRSGKESESLKHGLKESYEQSVRDKFGVKL